MTEVCSHIDYTWTAEGERTCRDCGVTGFSRQDTHFRISFAVESDVLEQGIELLLDL